MTRPVHLSVCRKFPVYAVRSELSMLACVEQSDQKQRQVIPTASAVLEDGTMIELIFRPDLHRTVLAIYSAGRWTLLDKFDFGADARLVPFSPSNNLIKNEAVLLPSEPIIYGSEAQLLSDIQ